MQNNQVKNNLKNIKLYDRAIKKDPSQPDPYYMKAKELIEIGEITNDTDQYYRLALDCLNVAVSLDHDNSLYLITRAKLFTKMQQFELAVTDIKAVQQLKSSDDVEVLYVENIIQELTSHDEIISLIAASDNNN